ncbi:MAG: F-box protein 11, partial [Abditibacteriota bacterium]|nr:F-box protein 11 [Abditibacteriota bacterium]
SIKSCQRTEADTEKGGMRRFASLPFWFWNRLYGSDRSTLRAMNPLPLLPPSVPSDVLPSGTLLCDGRYRLGEPLGRGGFGITYAATDTRSGREVAIKEFFPTGCWRHRDENVWSVRPAGALSEEAFARSQTQFLDGAHVLQQLRHPHLVRVYERWPEHNTAYLAMELLHGRTVLDVIEESGALEAQRASEIIEAVGEALEAIHRLGLLHLDIKPENVMLCPAAITNAEARSVGRVVLFDFDLMQRTDLAAGLGTRPLLAHCGTPGYAPLEQYTQRAAFDSFTDIYALGATLYHMVTGEAPPAATDRAHFGQMTAPTTVVPILDEALNEAILWALEMSEYDRPQSVAQWRRAFQEGRPKRVVPVAAPANTLGADDVWVQATAPTGFAIPSQSTFGVSQLPAQPAQAAIPVLAPLPRTDGWFRVAVHEASVLFPNVCACCGGSTKTFAPLRVKGHGVQGKSWQQLWEVPYCRRCARHVRAAHQSVVGTTWGMTLGLLVAAFGFAIPDILMSGIWLGPLGVSIHFSAMAYGVLKVQAAERIMRDECCDRNRAVAFGGQHGTKYFVLFRNLAYAHEFRTLNAGKLA